MTDDKNTDGESVDISPGEGGSADLFDDVDDDYDYSDAAETWIGEPAETEVAIESVSGAQVKRFHLQEPTEADAMTHIVNGFLRNDEYAVCRVIVAAPDIDDCWNKLTGREKAILYDRCLSWINIDEVIGQDTIRQLQSQENPDAPPSL